MHYWLYDALSLSHACQQASFNTCKQHTPFTSDIENWDSYHLDVQENGKAYDPHSLFLEAKK